MPKYKVWVGGNKPVEHLIVVEAEDQYEAEMRAEEAVYDIDPSVQWEAFDSIALMPREENEDA